MRQERCVHCGQTILKHRHSFNGSLAGILLKVAIKFDVSQPFHLQRDLDLTKSEYANFQKLRYWGLAEKYYENRRRRGGYWCLTKQVSGVLYNITRLPDWVETFNNEITGQSHNLIYFEAAQGEFEIPEIWRNRARLMRFSGERQQEFAIGGI